MCSCGVCGAVLDKKRVHYGGISCFKCRAFFRRMTNSDQQWTCELEGNCGRDSEEELLCKACRYQRCLAAGMMPGLVLTYEGIEKRFRKHHFNHHNEVETGHTSQRKTIWDISEIPFDFTGESNKDSHLANTSMLDCETGLLHISPASNKSGI